MLARRSIHHQIENIVAPLPSAMNIGDFGKEFLFISHPGERRQALVPSSAYTLQRFQDYGLEHFKEELASLGELERSFVVSQFGKIAMNYLKIEYLHDELRIENAIDFSVENNIPLVATICCEKTGKDFPKYKCIGGFSEGYVAYLNRLLLKNPRSYVIPTSNSRGSLIEDNGATLNEGYLFAKSEKGKEIFGSLLDHNWEKILLGGGQISCCLTSSIAYFIDHNLSFIDNFCCPSDGTIEKPYKEIRKRVEEELKKALRISTEKEARTKITKILEEYFPPEERIPEYEEVLFNLAGLKGSVKPRNWKETKINVVRLA